MSTSILPPARADDGLIHAALLYRDPELLRAVVAEFLADAMRESTPVLMALPTDSLRRLEGVLESDGAPMTLHDMTQVGRNPACLLGMIEDWMAAHPGPVRVVSEPMWPQRRAAEAIECLRHEALLNDAFADASASFLCPYDTGRLSSEVIVGAQMTHPHLLDESGMRPSPTFGDPLAMAAGLPWPLSPPPDSVIAHPYRGDLGALRHALTGDPLLAQLDEPRREDFVFAINEAVTNALRHGDGQVVTRVWADGDHVICEIVTATGVEDPYAGRRRPPATAAGGRGLWMINQLCDLVELRSDDAGMRLRLHVDTRS